MENTLGSLLALSAVAVTMVILTVLMHAVATPRWMRHLACRYVTSDGHLRPHMALPAVIWTALVLTLLHAMEVLVWALAYHVALPGDLRIPSRRRPISPSSPSPPWASAT